MVGVRLRPIWLGWLGGFLWSFLGWVEGLDLGKKILGFALVYVPPVYNGLIGSVLSWLGLLLLLRVLRVFSGSAGWIINNLPVRLPRLLIIINPGYGFYGV